MAINIILAGPRGKMGKEAIQMIERVADFNLVAVIDRKNEGKFLNDIIEESDAHVPIFEDLAECFQKIDADVFIDLTSPASGYKHTKLAIEHRVRSVIGTSGFTEERIQELKELSDEYKSGCIIAPNFAIGAVLMMKFSQMAAQYFPDVEIIEKHHDQKIDAPSGTAVKTAEMIQKTREKKMQGHPDEREELDGARGAELDGMHIHSVRLPGLVAHQEVIFGGPGQLFTIKHDSMSRDSFMDGIKTSIYKVMELERLVYGLENIL
ncbi:4-hydroxy-tetrahydrodipicolinate reductase [Oceanobacillus alkalisoli]|uniref:4-hydroxy-tetrahydrodipicolinate reductase n=1 Tax=Oceanobacillus alkalisoli TaxID=2925113 RepID=UPI001EF0321D|nr:4-hydroxy-tetrahydrodipicolinate reductase [Oceanobacillus alkalisoli]MCF3941622.1 4-hydroxy-tetrahydrodipicolinate reductase [Oceanobacillus alkalisoli]MCG5102904.1 4-hydroxy-tetrahydrodipicolinate reductase [Oceanobacillus alkalisoli]